MWKALGIPHTAAYHWMGIARQKLGLNPPIIDYTKEELKHAEEKAANENRLCALFEGLMFPHDVKQNCARNEYHFNIIIGPLTETEVIEVASKLKELEGDVNAAAS